MQGVDLLLSPLADRAYLMLQQGEFEDVKAF